jgi:pSer/pThr/pTyr-binding forkhead associated (FHA) protein
MGDVHGPIPAGGVCLQLLDSAQGQPIQTWRFTDQCEITIGREDGNDVVISDPHVSRHHVTLYAADDSWMLVSRGRHGTLIDSRLVAEAPLRPGVVFRLGPTGPMLRFDQGKVGSSISMTMDQIDPDAFAMFELDRERSQSEVERIASGALFDDLLQQSQRMRSARKDTGSSP